MTGWPATGARLPIWAHPQHPVLRYITRRTRQRRILRWVTTLVGIVMGGGLVAFCYLFYQDGTFDFLAGGDALYAILYFPLLAMQLWLMVSSVQHVLALGLTSSFAPLAQQRTTWEMVKVTGHGAELVTRARWVALFYDLRGALLLLIAARGVFAGRMLIDLAAGRHTLDTVPAALSVVLLAGVALVQPLVVVGFNAALGLVLSTISHRRAMIQVALALVILVELAACFGALLNGLIILAIGMTFEPGSDLLGGGYWAGLFFLAVTGDHSLGLLNLPTWAWVWANVNHALALSVAIPVALLFQAELTRRLLRGAVRRAVRPAQE